MKRIATSFIALSAFIVAWSSLSAQTCAMDSMEIVDVYACTYTTFRADVTFQHNQPADSTFTVWRKLIPNGNMQRLGSFPYSQDTVSLGVFYRNAEYAILILDDGNPDCKLRDTIRPQACPVPCMADMLELTDYVRCHLAANQLELDFEFTEPNFDGGFLFDVFIDSVFFTNLFMPGGEIMLPLEMIGDTLTICQTDQPGCCQTFIVPECNDYACQQFAVQDAEAVSCSGNLAHYVFAVQHDPPGAWTTDLAIYNELGQLVDFASLVEGDTLADLFIPGSAMDRTYAVCDVFVPFPYCCSELIVPAISCDSLPVGTLGLDLPGVRFFPNPVHDLLNIDVDPDFTGDESIVCRILSTTGGMVASGIINRSPMRVDVSSLPAGIYMVGLWQGDAPLGYRRVVKVW